MRSLATLQRHGRTVGGILVAVGAVVACVGVWSSGRPASQFSFVPGGVVLLGLGLVVAAACGATLWWSLLALVGPRRPWSTVARAWCGGTPAKYLPGKVGSVVARAALLGEPHALHAATATAEVLLTLAVGGLVALAIPLERTGTSTVAAAVVIGALSVVLVWFARRRLVTTSSELDVMPFVVAVAALAGGWVAQGMALGGAIVAVGGPLSSADMTVWCGIAGAAAIAGVLSPMPAGLGPRDALLGVLVVELLHEDVGRAAFAVFVWRLASVTVELALAAGAALASRWLARRAAPRGDEVQR